MTKTILLLGVSGVGKTSLIKNYKFDYSIPYNPEKSIMFSSSETIDYYKHAIDNEEYTLIDCPGLFSHEINTFERSCICLEHILSRIGHIDCVWFCISATHNKIRPIDIEAEKVLNEFSLPNIITIITKCDILDSLSFDNFIPNYIFGFSSPIDEDSFLYSFNDNKLLYISSPNEELLSDNWFNGNEFQEKILFNKVFKQKKLNLVENQHIEVINQIQKEFYDNNLYSPKYFKYYQNDFPKLTFMIILLFLFVMYLIFRLNITKLEIYTIGKILEMLLHEFLAMIFILLIAAVIAITIYIINNVNSINTKTVKINFDYYVKRQLNLKLLKLGKNNNNNILIKDKIYYSNNKIFYEGSLYGNTFNVGKFYNIDGMLFYDKKC
ncbi:septin family GTPase [Hokovirus HKV1]|uniref:Septin family GTPase n=1 Tax=Hokovirus HKV1 TaxID=1977638 RepID=A0A1V0SEJ1_9VIRU|nr:septin family GTPase [Hokovirus HKV1]